MAPAMKLCATLVLATSAFRVRPKNKKAHDAAAPAAKAPGALHQAAAEAAAHGPEVQMIGPAAASLSSVGEPGTVDFVYTFGAPGSASPGLQNQRGDNPCFPGVRIWQTTPGTFWGKWLDVVARIGNAIFYYHPWMPGQELDDSRNRKWDFPCNRDMTYKPDDALSTSVNLHQQERYIGNVIEKYTDQWYHNISIFANRKSYIHDIAHVHEHVQQYGWRLAGTAIEPGGTIYGGAQVIHLIQHPTTFECTLTFQGTASIQGWMSNFNLPSSSFCGLSYEGESCNSLTECRPRRPKGSFVHSGFKDRIMMAVKTNDFQQNILPKLPSCSRVYTAGHSLGGAVAELFAACASNAPQQGEFGWEDYKWMAWNKGPAARLAYVGE